MFLSVRMMWRKNKVGSKSLLIKQRQKLYGYGPPPVSDRIVKLEFELKQRYLYELTFEAHELHVEKLLQMNQEQLAKYFSHLNDLGYRNVFEIIEEQDDKKRRELILIYKEKWAPLIEEFDPRYVSPYEDVWKGFPAWRKNIGK